MSLFKVESAEVEATDGTYTTTGDQSFDLNVAVSASVTDNAETSISLSPSPGTAGTEETVTVTAKDQYGNQQTTGGDTVVISVAGANSSTPSVTDNGNGTYSANYTPTHSGQDLITGTINASAIGADTDGVSDGTYHLSVSAAEVNAAHSVISVLPSPVAAETQVTITVTTRDQYDNSINIGGATVVLSVTGANSATPSVTDNGNGTYSANYTPMNTGQDLITGTLNASAIGADTDGTSDGTFHLTVNEVGVPGHFVITGSATQIAGSSQSITIMAIDINGGLDATYNGDFALTFSGANDAPDGTHPKVKDKTNADVNFGSAATITFTNGVATTDMALYKVENAEVETTDGTYTTTGSPNYDLNVSVTVAATNAGETSISASPDPAYANRPVTVTVTAKDAFGNPRTAGGDTVAISVAGANSETPSVIDNSDGTYIAIYTPTNLGEDLITGTINASAIGADTDGVSDGTYHLTVDPLPMDHFVITGSATQVAGASQAITITAIDVDGYTYVNYTGDHALTFSGAADAPDGTHPKVKDKDSIDVNFGSAATVTFTNGVATTDMALFKVESAEVETSDGTFSTAGSQAFDLNVAVTVAAADSGTTSISVSPDPASIGRSVTVLIISFDAYGNPQTTGGDTVTLSVAGSNSATPSVTDNNDGTYSATYTPTNIGEDLITGTLNASAIGADTDGTSDGTYHLTVNPLPMDHFVITGSATQEAGATQTITITAKDEDGNTFANYTGDHALTFSGAADAPDGTHPKVKDKTNADVNFGSAATITFVNGVATTDMALFKVESAEIETTDGTYTTTGSQTYDLNVSVTVAGTNAGETSISASPAPVAAGAQVTITVTGKDAYGNPVSVGGATVVLSVAGANSANPSVTDNGNGTYTATYTPTNAGEDLITGTLNASAIGADTDGTSDGTFHLTVTAGAGSGTNSIISASPSPVVTGNQVTITVSAYDQYDNQITIGGAAVTLSVNGSNSATPSVTDNLNGTYTATYIPTHAGEDQITGTINSSAIQKDTDGTSDGTFHLTVNAGGGSASHFEITGSDSQVAGTTQTITITAYDTYENIITAYAGDHALTFSGANDSPDGTHPRVKDKDNADVNFSSAATITFTDWCRND